jgi:spore germination cell wall hydrolase CwlJ-like protein
MRSSKSMTGDEGQSRAIVAEVRSKSIVVRNSNLAVIPPRPLSLTVKARRSFAKLTGYGVLAAIFAFSGYAYRDPDIRRTMDYRMTLLISPGISSVPATFTDRMMVTEPLPVQAMHLFAENQKGPRADKFAYAMRAVAADSLSHADKANAPGHGSTANQPVLQTAAIANASLFLSAFGLHDEGPLPGEFDAPAPAAQSGGQWAGLLKNASLSPEEPKSLFGGLTEDEFRARELRCMATAIYFEARDEPIKGQIAVAQVVMNRIRSPFYPKTVCGVVYQGERNRHGCQFSFTCTGKRNTVNEKEEWATAVKLAKQVIAGEVWINEVGYATHYHATYVHPPWRHELDKVAQIGGHIFYKMKPGTIQVALLSEGL